MPWWLSWLVNVMNLVGFWLAGSKRWYSWPVLMGGEVLWFTYGLASRQPAFSLGAVIFFLIFSRNAWRWYRPATSEGERTS